MATAYRIYTQRNLADTTRDPDQIVIKELGYRFELDDAKSLATEYIKEHFFHKDSVLIERKNGYFSAVNFMSYGEILYVEPIMIE